MVTGNYRILNSPSEIKNSLEKKWRSSIYHLKSMFEKWVYFIIYFINESMMLLKNVLRWSILWLWAMWLNFNASSIESNKLVFNHTHHCWLSPENHVLYMMYTPSFYILWFRCRSISFGRWNVHCRMFVSSFSRSVINI